MLKIGFITAIREDFYHPGEYAMKRIAANLGPVYLASYLRKNCPELEVEIKDRLEDLAAFQPDILGISSVTENIEFAKALAKRAKELWNPLVILGGVHITALPKSLPDEFDLGVIGEGEETLAALVELFGRLGRFTQEDLSKISGISYPSKMGVHFTGFRKGMASLDEIPLPAREEYIKASPITYMMTSRGCPYTCNFCVIPSTSGTYRVHSPHYVVEEMKSIKQHYPEVKNIRIFDDLYIVDRKRVDAIAELVNSEGINQELSFGCWGRANLIDEVMVETFRKMNMIHVAFGAESGSSRIMSMIKPGCSVEDNQRAIDLLHDNGISVACSIIMGHPLETEEDLWATHDFIQTNLDKLFDVEFNVALPWPGTDLWNYAKNRKLVSERMDFTPLKECAYFPNYCTDLYPYLNERILPERFDVIMASFKKLHRHFYNKNSTSGEMRVVTSKQDIASYY